MRRVVALCLITVGVACAQGDYTRDVAPIFAQRCIGCHGPSLQMNGLRLDDPAAVLKGGDSGPVVQAGSSPHSKLVQRVTSTKKGFAMPPSGAALTAGQIESIRAWIDGGAKIPKTGSAAPDPRAAHWSFQPVKRPNSPAVHDAAWPRTPIDRFILARLDGEKVRPSPEADRTTLLRRVSLDLIGLPPTPAEVEAFLADTTPDAYEHVVNRLLASPHYGEKWARPWLDLAHYADSDGYEKDLTRPNAWRYRQWVIEALNRDLPFDQFTIQQLAADELPNASVEQRVATGFLRNTLTNRESGVDRSEARFDQIVNRTNTVATTWLGLTVGCAQCHNHKFDPISHKDYYSFFAFFNNVEEVDVDAPLGGELGAYMRAKPEYDHKRREILDEYHIAELEAQWEARITQAFREQGKDLEWDFALTEFRPMFDGADKLLKGFWTSRTQEQTDRLIDYFVGHIGPDFDKDQTTKDRLRDARSKLNKLAEALPQITRAPVIIDDRTVPPGANIHVGGDYQTLGAAVAPCTPAVLPALPSAGTPNRLTLARWLVARENPLTARVAVNRMWQEFFGRGLVATSEDFGTQGDRPTHPELLDWLASEFMDSGWSMKHMHKLIVMSAAYRQSSHARPDLETRDPENALVARQLRLRLPGELIRDEALHVSGLLNPAIGGPSIRPPEPAGVAELTYGRNGKWVESTGVDRYRRGLYIHFQRTAPYPMLMNFDEPDSNTTCTRRRRSNTPLQALNLMDDPVFYEAAQALATRILRETSGDTVSRLDAAFLLCVGRKPAAFEKERLLKYFDNQAKLLSEQPKIAAGIQPYVVEGADPAQAAAWVEVSRVLLNLDEFITRE